MDYRHIVEVSETQTVVTNEMHVTDTLDVSGEKQADNVFHRETMSANIKFSGATYETIHALSLIEEVFFIVEKKVSGVWVERWRGLGYTSDAEDNEEECIITISFETVDKYTLVEDGRKKRFNLIDLAPDLVNVSYVRQGLIQVYIEGNTFISNYLSDGVYFETQLPQRYFNVPPNPSFTDDFHFGVSIPDIYHYLPDDGTLNPPVGGLYPIGTGLPVTRIDGAYRIELNGPVYEIVEVSSGTVVYRSDTGTVLSTLTPTWEVLNDGTLTRATFVSLVDGVSKTRSYVTPVYCRVLTNLETVNGNPTFELSSDDIDPSNSIYSRALPVELTPDDFIFSSLNSVEPDKFGLFDADSASFAGRYFNRPPNINNEELQPIGRSNWGAFSFWLNKGNQLRTLQEDASETILNTNSYTLDSVIKVLVQELDPSLTFLPDSDHSEFFYGTNPIRTISQHPIVAIKNDIKVGQYDTPAKKAEITLDELLNMLYVVYRNKYFIEGTMFRLEHEDYYQNGKSYTSENIDTDLTTLNHPSLGKSWETGTKIFTTDKEDMAERFQFRWMDEVSPPFEGFPIDILSPYVKKGKVDDLDVSKFTTDLEFITAQSNDITKQGFVLLECDQVDALNYTVPFLTMVVDGTTYTMQNGHASFFFIHETYWPYRLSGDSVLINNTTRVVTVMRRKNQTVRLPGVVGDYMALITASKGSALIDSYQENTFTGFLELKLKHGIS